ncbi:MAG: cobalt ECF transporter T component CbiQ [Acidobacteriia bacterium]|nr:cobalt ECF transporter T component CbiQ [Terriglobia bacterium]
MKHSFVDRYANLDSPLHLLDARTKVIGFSALVVAALLIPAASTGEFFLFFFLMAILAGISQIPMQYVVARTVAILPFVLLAGLAAPWRGSAGWAWFLALLLRSILCLLILILLTNTTRFIEMLRGLRKLGCPKILVANLSFLYRYLFVLSDEVMRMQQARDCRRIGKVGALMELRTLGSMLGTLMVRSFERADHMYQAMLSRGFSGEFPVSAPRRFSWRDLAFISVVALFVAATIYL